jgi:tetratricopeptide (TPR) repeat protein
LGASDYSKRVLEQSLVLAKEIYEEGDERLLSIVNMFTTIKAFAKNDATAEDVIKKTLEECPVDKPYDIMRINRQLCQVYAANGKFDAAMEHGLKALAYARETGDMERICDLLYGLTIIQCDQGNWDEAFSYVEEVLPIMRIHFGEKSVSVGNTLYQLGKIYQHQGKYDDALRVSKKALRYVRRGGGDEQSNVEKYVMTVLELSMRLKKKDEITQMMVNNETILRKKIPNYDEVYTVCKGLAATN